MPVPTAAADRWSVQIGAFAKRGAAEKAVATAAAKLPGKETVQIVPPGRLDKERLYRARFVNFTKKDATAACHALHRRHMTCSIVAPEATKLAAN